MRFLRRRANGALSDTRALPVLIPPTVDTARTCTVHCHGETMLLYPERALYLPAHGALVVADLHWGKDATFRAARIPVPTGTTASDLTRLTAVLARTGATSLVILGDLLHARAGRNDALFAEILAWRTRHAALRITLVRGNHDTRAGDPPASLGIDVVDAPWMLGSLVCHHEPTGDPAGYVLSGHLHPSVTIGGRGGYRDRLCCFVFGGEAAILPAFTEFTGGGAYTPSERDRVYAIAGDEVIEL